MTIKKVCFILAIGVWICSCIEPYEITFPYGKKILTVDATISDKPEEQTFTITESESRNSVVYSFPVRNLKVEVLVNKTERITLTEKEPGIYALPASFQVQTGSIYKLFF